MRGHRDRGLRGAGHQGLYAKAPRGEVKGFTGIDDPYEPPHNPKLVLDTVRQEVGANAGRILGLLVERGFVRS